MTLQQSDAIAKLVIQQEIVTNDYSHITRNSQSTHLIAPLQPSRFQSITKGWRCENQSSAHYDIARVRGTGTLIQ